MKFLEDTNRIVTFIENNLDDDIWLDDIMQLTRLSKFHYSRIFKALTGITLSEYIRRRKLSCAALDLVETKKAIIDIAFACGYESQAAFTRGFKAMYGFTPKAYRLNKMHFANLDQVIFNEAILSLKKGEDRIEPIFIERGKINIVGLQYRGDNSKREIPKLWSRLALRMAEIKNAANSNFSYGFETYGDDRKDSNVLTYVAGVEAGAEDPLPPGLVSVEIPANQYAAFPIAAIIEEVPKTIRRIYGELLFAWKIEPCGDYDFELFDETFIPNDAAARYYLCIPIK